MRHRSVQTRASSLTAAAVLASALAGFGIQSSADASFTLDVRLSAGQAGTVTASADKKSATLASGFANGGTVNLDVYGLVTGTDANTSNEGLNEAFFGVGSTTNANGSVGNLSPVTLQPLWLGTASAGTGTVNTGFSGSQYTNAQGNLDVGSTNSAAPDGWVFARATSMQPGNSFFLGTLTYTVGTKGTTGTTTINAIPRTASATVFPAIWQEDQTNVGDSTELVGTPVTISVAGGVPIIPGDTEPDGDVDGSDFVVWSNHVGGASSSPFYTFGDFDKDGDVDGSDFVIWSNHVGQSGGGISEPGGIAVGALAAVPEPTSLGLIGLSAMGLIARRRKA